MSCELLRRWNNLQAFGTLTVARATDCCVAGEGACGEPPRAGELGLQVHHAQLQPRSVPSPL
eukprot:9264368-Pyramimonas_sp.AAC.1